MTNPAAAPFSDFADELLGAAAEAEELPLDSRGNEEVEVSEASDDWAAPDGETLDGWEGFPVLVGTAEAEVP